MRVTKRSGRIEDMKFDNVTNRIKNLTYGLSENCDSTKIAQQVFSSMYDGISTHEIDTLSAEICVGMITSDPDYEILATRIVASNIQKVCPNTFHLAMKKLAKAGIVTDEVADIAGQVKDEIKTERDFDFGYFGLKTLEKSYLQRHEGKLMETPQYMYMRVAIGIHGADIPSVLETYDKMSQGLFIHATPTLFNAGTPRPQMSSCFVAGTPVFTTNRGPVPIEEVCVGDTVVTHTGSIKPVLQTHKNPLDERTLFDIKIYKTPGLQVTGNHRFWSITKEQLHWGESPQWNRIDHLRVGDWIAIPNSKTPPTEYQVLDMYDILKDVQGAEHWTYSFEFNGTKMRRNTHFTSEYRPNGITKKGEWFERYITVDEKFAWFLGSWYGDGCILYQRSSVAGKRTPTHRGIAFAQNPNNTTFIEEITRIGEKYLGAHASIHTAKKQNCLSISFNNSAIGNAFNILFGRWSDKKLLWPAMYSWNRSMVTAFIGGLVSTDGCCTLNGSVTVQLTNQPLIQSIFLLTRSVGLDTSMTIMTKPYMGRDTYIGRMQIPWIPELMKWVRKYYPDNRLMKSERANTTLEIDGHIFLRINGKTKVTEDLPEFVYTLGVEDDHSYSVGGVIAENCFLIANKGDSIDGIYGSLTECAQISKWAGGIGMHIHDVRANKSRIRGTNGQSDGIIPMLRVFNATARYVNQAGRRKGSIAVYLEPWHADIMDFLELRLNQGDEEARCRDLFSALWIPDLFMKRVEQGGNWSLFCPDKAPGLSNVYGEEFEALYTKYEEEGLANATVPAGEVWKAILKSQTETGTPYMLYKDACNAKSNQKNLGVIKSSNLCVAPETKILTREGQQTISELKDKDVEVWNGEEFSKVTVKQTGQDQKLLTVKTSKGLSLRCTPYHKFWIVGESEPIEAQNLQEGMKIIKHSLPDGSVHENEKIVSVEDVGETADTFCFNEPLRHRGIFNGILTGNCTEIIEYTDKDETSVCNLASIALPKYVNRETKTFDYAKLHDVTKVVTKNLNRVIDRNFYPVETARKSNMRHRPIGLGVQGLADVFILCGLPFDCEESRLMNAHIFETMYHAALEASSELAEVEGSYETFEGSPASQGILQHDMWEGETKCSGRYDWDAMRTRVQTKGLRNSLLMAPMPTASTAQILGNNECFEPYTTNIYLRRTLAGEFVVVNRHLVDDLKRVGLWSKEMKDLMVKAGGSIQNIIDIPEDIKKLYKTVWEISQKAIIDMAADRGRFIDQSQSMNLFMESPTLSKLSSMHMYAWKSGLKTGMYYLRSKAKARPIQFSLEPECVMCSA
jgi:ribonucleotide reductase alpha subunit